MAKNRSIGSGIVGGRTFLSSVLVVLILATAATLIFAACGGGSSSQSSSQSTSTPQQAAIPTVTIKAMDFSFNEPQTVPAGLVDVKFVNNGPSPHQVQIARVNNGNFTDFATALEKQGPEAALMLSTLYGGANVIDSGQQEEVILNLPSGTYASICFVSGSDGVPHYAKGMISQFNVTGSPNTNAQPPQANGTVTLQDFSFSLPATIPAGAMTLKVTNNGPQAHEMGIIKLAQGKTISDALNFLNQAAPSGPPPFTDAGGMGALQPGTSAWVKLDLQPGNYAALCFVPDIKTGKPHYMLGMYRAFTVQ